jgi:hypothetical protein
MYGVTRVSSRSAEVRVRAPTESRVNSADGRAGTQGRFRPPLVVVPSADRAVGIATTGPDTGPWALPGYAYVRAGTASGALITGSGGVRLIVSLRLYPRQVVPVPRTYRRLHCRYIDLSGAVRVSLQARSGARLGSYECDSILLRSPRRPNSEGWPKDESCVLWRVNLLSVFFHFKSRDYVKERHACRGQHRWSVPKRRPTLVGRTTGRETAAPRGDAGRGSRVAARSTPRSY